MFVELIWRPKVWCGGISSCSFIVLEILGEIPLELLVVIPSKFHKTSIKLDCNWMQTCGKFSCFVSWTKLLLSTTALHTTFNYLRLLTTQMGKVFFCAIFPISRGQKIIFWYFVRICMKSFRLSCESWIQTLTKKCCWGRWGWRTTTLWSRFLFCVDFHAQSFTAVALNICSRSRNWLNR